jgi:hypothetical protein
MHCFYIYFYIYSRIDAFRTFLRTVCQNFFSSRSSSNLPIFHSIFIFFQKCNFIGIIVDKFLSNFFVFTKKKRSKRKKSKIVVIYKGGDIFNARWGGSYPQIFGQKAFFCQCFWGSFPDD